MTIEEAVVVVRELIGEGDRPFAERHGEEGLSSAQAMHSLLRDRLSGELAGRLSLGALWRDFEAEPYDTAPSVVGVLEALVEADASLGQELKVLLGEYETVVVARVTASSGSSRVGVPDEEALAPRPIEEVPVVDREADRGQGEYMYGNVQSSSVTLEEGEPLEHVPPRQVTEVGELDTQGVVAAPTLDSMYAIAEAYPDLSAEDRERLEGDVGAVFAELERRSVADEETLVAHLRRIGETEPEVLEAVLERIEADTARLGLPAALAAREMRAWLAGTRSA